MEHQGSQVDVVFLQKGLHLLRLVKIVAQHADFRFQALKAGFGGLLDDMGNFSGISGNVHFPWIGLAAILNLLSHNAHSLFMFLAGPKVENPLASKLAPDF